MNKINENNENNENNKNNENNENNEINEICEKNETKKDKNNDCIELRNLKYKTMLLNGVNLEENKKSNSNNNSSISNLVNFLENEKNNNKVEQWVKLNKTLKIQKLKVYANKYKLNNNLTNDEEENLNIFFIDCLDRKKLYKVKDVNYDKVTGEIKDIPSLFFNKNSNKFTLKILVKNHISTIKFLTPKKKSSLASCKNTKLTICDFGTDEPLTTKDILTENG